MPLEQLPEEGLDWILVKGLEDKRRNIEPDTLGGLLIIINPKLQGKGISSSIISELIARTRRGVFKRLIIPIRPNLKSRYPLISISQYSTCLAGAVGCEDAVHREGKPLGERLHRIIQRQIEGRTTQP